MGSFVTDVTAIQNICIDAFELLMKEMYQMCMHI